MGKKCLSVFCASTICCFAFLLRMMKGSWYTKRKVFSLPFTYFLPAYVIIKMCFIMNPGINICNFLSLIVLLARKRSKGNFGECGNGTLRYFWLVCSFYWSINRWKGCGLHRSTKSFEFEITIVKKFHSTENFSLKFFTYFTLILIFFRIFFRWSCNILH